MTRTVRNSTQSSPETFYLLQKTKVSGGGDKGIRTLDPLLAKQVLSQLSYIPMMAGCTRQRAPHENDSCTVIQYTQSSPFSILIRHFVRRSCCLLFIPTSKEAVDIGNAFFRRTDSRRTV